ncbi:MAG TPA: DUF6801 domain-containing protein, partial [Actinophytocola sp.]|uniref:DUF6801 domain-containing protein n=1 Tax=Actinophytocola sp. TaxID=1872138 RepID=UPI002DDD60FD
RRTPAGGTARPRVRRAVMLGVVGALVASAYTGSAPAAAGPIDVFLNYTCAFPAGPRAVQLEVSAFFPDRVIPGRQIQPSVSYFVTLPPESVADLRALGADTVGGTARLDVTVLQDAPSDPGWPGLTLLDSPLDSGPLFAFGDVAPTTMGTGPAVYLAGGLTLDLAPTSGGVPTDPPVLTGTCGLDAGQDPTLATVQPLTGVPPECGNIPAPPGGFPSCAFINGHANVNKLGASIRIEPGLTNVAVVPPTQDGDVLRADNPAELVGGRLPPMTGTFLAFGFMPVLATLEMIQAGPMVVHTEGLAVEPFTFSVRASAQLDVRVIAVTVNGVPLDVGPNCRSATPMNLVLDGGTPDYTNILRGGPLSGFADIPPFAGCGTTENLDRLLTGMVSSNGNFVRAQQGPVCAPDFPDAQDVVCPPMPAEVPPPGAR